jgi:hypothetical protein
MYMCRTQADWKQVVHLGRRTCRVKKEIECNRVCRFLHPGRARTKCTCPLRLDALQNKGRAKRKAKPPRAN